MTKFQQVTIFRHEMQSRHLETIQVKVSTANILASTVVAAPKHWPSGLKMQSPKSVAVTIFDIQSVDMSDN